MYSFDVFDTLITRKTAVPEGIFAIMQYELGKEEYAVMPVSMRSNFYQLRIAAERLARQSYQQGGIEDVTLEQIYDVLAVRGELSREQQIQLVRLECDIEYRECIPIEKNVIQVKKLLADGEKVILISDMYLPKNQIYKMLAKADPDLAELQLYVSGDCKKRKYTGAIYEFAMKQSNFIGAECIHIGDNEKVDIVAARNAGFRSRLSWFPNLLPIEKNLLDKTPGNVWLNRVIGCSRRARLRLGEEMTEKGDVLVGTSVGGILLVFYMQWVIRNALAKGIERLYFMAPDGDVLKRVADIVIQKTGTAIETYYSQGDICTSGRFAFVAMTEKTCIQKYMSGLLHDSYAGGFQIFLFSLDQITSVDNCSIFVFYPGRIRKWDILEHFCDISGSKSDYLAGVEKFTEFFCEDGQMIVQTEDMEQLWKMLTYITETPDKLMVEFLCGVTGGEV
ncbi:MAG: HAD-IA family hydrolase [Lachnospiraceae bacterium]|nr:HAD-IA family hydrolase [Lachnospiraceae bacterium]